MKIDNFYYTENELYKLNVASFIKETFLKNQEVFSIKFFPQKTTLVIKGIKKKIDYKIRYNILLKNKNMVYLISDNNIYNIKSNSLLYICDNKNKNNKNIINIASIFSDKDYFENNNFIHIFSKENEKICFLKNNLEGDLNKFLGRIILIKKFSENLNKNFKLNILKEKKIKI